MPAPPSSADALAEFLSATPVIAVEAIASGLEDGRITLDTSAVGIHALPSVSAQAAQRASIAFTAVRGSLDSRSVAIAMRMGNRLRVIERHGRPEIEVVWTGPRADGPIVHATATVVEEMIRDVREAGEVLLVGYSLTARNGTVMRRIVDLLGGAARRRAVITIVLHRDEGEKNRQNLLQAWSVFARKPRVFTWTPPPGILYQKLHAKALVVDRLEALVTSANLTTLGLEHNLELGLRVRGPQAGMIAERFDHLMAQGVLTEWL
jgi:phosphatidylserine/phosphatidylglycerophosphate/cardiolipin synthase-like enzyme